MSVFLSFLRALRVLRGEIIYDQINCNFPYKRGAKFGQMGQLVIALNHQHSMLEMLRGSRDWDHDGHRIQTHSQGADLNKKNKRKKDPFVDRRSGEDQRAGYDMDYFTGGGKERRSGKERRRKGERREGCIPVSDWSSVCPDDET